MATALSLYPTDSLLIKSIPVIISGFNELIIFTDGKIVEDGLCQLEEGIQCLGIELEKHNQFVLGRHAFLFSFETSKSGSNRYHLKGKRRSIGVTRK